MRRFLYSRWFFLFLAVACLLDLLADIFAVIEDQPIFDRISIAADLLPAAMAVWIFFDLQKRRPQRDGTRSDSRG